MECSSCNAKVQREWRACPICGQQLHIEPVCAECGEEIGHDWKFCPNCGTPVEETHSDETKMPVDEVESEEFSTRDEIEEIVALEKEISEAAELILSESEESPEFIDTNLIKEPLLEEELYTEETETENQIDAQAELYEHEKSTAEEAGDSVSYVEAVDTRTDFLTGTGPVEEDVIDQDDLDFIIEGGVPSGISELPHETEPSEKSAAASTAEYIVTDDQIPFVKDTPKEVKKTKMESAGVFDFIRRNALWSGIILGAIVCIVVVFTVKFRNPQVGRKIVITSYKCNFRQTPEINSSNIITTLNRGDIGTIRKVIKVNGGTWYQVENNGRTGWLASTVCLTIKGYEGIFSGSSKRGQSSVDLEELYSQKYQNLYEKVKGYYSKADFDYIMSKREKVELDRNYLKRLRFLASPRSKEMQKQLHEDRIPVFINEETIRKGRSFFWENIDLLQYAYKMTGVNPADIISILNWESKLGEYTGKYFVFNTLIGQYFFIDDIERELFEKGAYTKSNTMERNQALKRIEKLKKRALSNLSELMIKSKMKNFDLYEVKGSWAGAIGICQFMPRSMVYASDGDGDGEIDLNTMPDAIMSVASYLKQHEYHERGREYAIRCYNPEDAYVRGVVLYSLNIEKIGVKPQSNWGSS